MFHFRNISGTCVDHKLNNIKQGSSRYCSCSLGKRGWWPGSLMESRRRRYPVLRQNGQTCSKLRCGKGYKETRDGSRSDWAVERALQSWRMEEEKCVECEVPGKQHRFQLGSWHFEWGAQGGLSKIDLGVDSRVGDNGSHVSEWHIQQGVCRQTGMGTKLRKLLDPGKGFQSCLCLGLVMRLLSLQSEQIPSPELYL